VHGHGPEPLWPGTEPGLDHQSEACLLHRRAGDGVIDPAKRGPRLLCAAPCASPKPPLFNDRAEPPRLQPVGDDTGLFPADVAGGRQERGAHVCRRDGIEVLEDELGRRARRTPERGGRSRPRSPSPCAAGTPAGLSGGSGGAGTPSTPAFGSGPPASGTSGTEPPPGERGRRTTTRSRRRPRGVDVGPGDMPATGPRGRGRHQPDATLGRQRAGPAARVTAHGLIKYVRGTNDPLGHRMADQEFDNGQLRLKPYSLFHSAQRRRLRPFTLAKNFSCLRTYPGFRWYSVPHHRRRMRSSMHSRCRFFLSRRMAWGMDSPGHRSIRVGTRQRLDG